MSPGLEKSLLYVCLVLVWRVFGGGLVLKCWFDAGLGMVFGGLGIA